jgi:hypothetical protein
MRQMRTEDPSEITASLYSARAYLRSRKKSKLRNVIYSAVDLRRNLASRRERPVLNCRDDEISGIVHEETRNEFCESYNFPSSSPPLSLSFSSLSLSPLRYSKFSLGSFVFNVGGVVHVGARTITGTPHVKCGSTRCTPAREGYASPVRALSTLSTHQASLFSSGVSSEWG